MRDTPNHDRPREKLASRGPQVLSDAELIALLLGRGTKERDVWQVANDVRNYLKDAGGIPSYNDLLEIEGIGSAKACEIMACFELGRRYHAGDGVAGQRVLSPEDILPLVAEWRNKKQEYFICITLNGAGEVIDRRVVTIGIRTRVWSTRGRYLLMLSPTVRLPSSWSTTILQAASTPPRRISVSRGSLPRPGQSWVSGCLTTSLSQRTGMRV